MNAADLAALVDRGLAIVAEQARLKIELASIERTLKDAGLHSEHIELRDAEREGRQYLARGSRAVVPVVFSADLLIASFRPQSPIHLRVQELAADHLPEFFEETVSFEKKIASGKAFRARADELLAGRAAPFITACLQLGKGGVPKSKISVEWDAALAGKPSEAAA